MDDKDKSQTFQTPELVVTETGSYVPEQQAYLNLVRTSQELGQQVSDLLAKHSLSGKQYNALRAIRRGGTEGTGISQINDQMTDPRADVTRLVDRLVRDGLVERQHDDHDRRVVKAYLTAKGDELLNLLDEPMLLTHRNQLKGLSQPEIKQLILLLQKARGA
ncbi:MAG: MarR family transcriptional regulator [Pseudomonadota bacterium]